MGLKSYWEKLKEKALSKKQKSQSQKNTTGQKEKSKTENFDHNNLTAWASPSEERIKQNIREIFPDMAPEEQEELTQEAIRKNRT